MNNLIAKMDEFLSKRTVENLAVRVGVGEKILFERFLSNSLDLTENTSFDMASVTKIVATTTLALMAMDRGELALTDLVGRFYPTEKEISVKNLLTHTIGIGHKSMNAPTVDYDNVAQFILSIPQDIPIGSDVLYSCPAFVLLGKILEKIYGERLDKAFCRHVAQPLGLYDTEFLPNRNKKFVNSNINEADIGIVNDYNCRHLGGVAGNAGLFSTMKDMTKYAQFLLNKGAPLISEKTFALACENHTPNMSADRGLGFLCVFERYAQTGGLFPNGSFGHCGHTGQSVFVDTKSGLFVVVLSDATKSVTLRDGNENYACTIDMRTVLHKAIKADLTAQ